jgi:hypothetical protein
MQIFHHSTNTIAKVSIFGGLFLVAASLWVLAEINRSSYNTGQFIEVQQPVQFSHKHHVGDDGIDCRYCHTSVDKASFAGIPPTETCMTCHSQIWTDSPNLAPVRESFRTGQPLHWLRIHDLPDFVYFNHSIHVRKGIGCASCHGKIDEMPLTWKENTLSMAWCVNCHRNPEKNIRPQDYIYDLNWTPAADQKAQVIEEASKPTWVPPGKPVRQVRAGNDTYHILSEFQMTNCSTCHY